MITAQAANEGTSVAALTHAKWLPWVADTFAQHFAEAASLMRHGTVQKILVDAVREEPRIGQAVVRLATMAQQRY